VIVGEVVTNNNNIEVVSQSFK